MCGIVGYVGKKDARAIILDGLQKLEYRGYDSAGVGLVDNGKVKIFKDKGRVSHLKDIVDTSFETHVGIGHTRWATHGSPTKMNAHPHTSQSGRFTIVHNGVIENFRELKAKYLSNYTFKSQTDTEVIADLLERYFNKYGSFDRAFSKTLSRLEGSFALLILDNKNLDTIYFAKNKTPLVVGIAEDGIVFGSDVIPLAGNAEKYVSLNDGVKGKATKDGVEFTDFVGLQEDIEYKELDITADELTKGSYPHFMLKEINEEPSVVRKLIQEYFDEEDIVINEKLLETIRNCDKINLVACGTSMHASYMAKYFFEKFCEIPTEVFCASELVYSTPLIKDNPCFIFLSQSGETADSIACMKKFNDQKFPIIAITNISSSTMASIADFHLDLHAGPEVAVASTKAYAAEVIVTCILAKAVRGKKTHLSYNLEKCAVAMEEVISKAPIIEMMAKQIIDAKDVFFIGRGIDYWACLECSLKLKEISYIHSEAFPSGELKHGTIALIEKGTPVITICTQEGTNPIVRNNLVETQARGSKPFVISTESLSVASDAIDIPNVNHYLSPLISVIVGQLLAYYIATLKGNDVDKPKNLAKSVTVE